MHIRRVQIERAVGGRVRAMLEAMAGIGLPGTKNPENPELDAVKLRQAAALASQVDGPERLTLFISEAFKVPVQLKEFVATWMTIPAALQTRLGKEHASLGRSATIGPRSFNRQSRIELRIGPLGYEDFKSFLPGGERLGVLKRAICDLVGEVLDVDLRIVLARDEVPVGPDRNRAARAGPRGLRPPMKGAMLRICACGRSSDGGRKRRELGHELASHARARATHPGGTADSAGRG